MPKPWYSIKAAAEGTDVDEISILEDIHPWFGCNAQTFLREFRALKANTVRVYINSPGGSVIEALAIFNGMRATGKKIEAHVLGIAASAASYIAMAADKIVMPANTFMFLHNPEAPAHGNADELREVADTLDKMAVSLTATYAKRWKGEEKALALFLRDEPLLTAAECLEHGFCDEVIDEMPVTASFDIDALPPAAREAFEAAAAKHRAPAAPEQKPAAPVVDAALADQIAAAARAAELEPYIAVFATDPTATSIEAAQRLIASAREVKALAAHAGLADRADALIRGRKSVDEARAELAEVLASTDAKTRVDTTSKVKPAAGAAVDFSPMNLWAEINALKAGSKQ